MDTVVRIWVVACMLLFTLRQFLPDYEPRFSVLQSFAILFALLLTGIAGASVYRRTKKGHRSSSAEKAS